MDSRAIQIETGNRPGLTDLTGQCVAFLGEVEATDGLLSIFVPHATAGIAVDDRWRHDHGSPGHGADHVLPLLVSPSLSVPVVDGRMTLGTWQSIALLDTNRDNPRRTVRLTFLPG